MKEECSKYGTVNHAHVDKNSKVALFLCQCARTTSHHAQIIAKDSAQSQSLLLVECAMSGIL